jgi:HlyD family secretion protein
VISRSVDVGQTVAASLQAPELFKIAQDLRKEQVDASVSEADVGKLKPGMATEFTVSAYPNETFRGRVRQVRNAATTTQNVVTYDAVIDVDNPELKLKPGMTANVTFVWADRPDALRVPNAALRFTPPASAFGDRQGRHRRGQASGEASGAASANAEGSAGGSVADGGDRPARERIVDPTRKRVWVLQEGKPRPVRVRVGISDGAYTEVVGGKLNAGDAVITDSSEGSGSGSGSGSGRSGGGMRGMGMGGGRRRGMF